MDKVTQVMVQSKAAAIKSDMKKNMDNIWGEENEEDKAEHEIKRRQNSVRDMEEKREKERLEREDVHKKRDAEREKIRSNIRDKYKLKGSNLYDGTYGHDGKDSEFAQNMNNVQAKKKDSCNIQ